MPRAVNRPVEEWDKLSKEGLSFSQIGRRYRVTRNVVAGALHSFRNPRPKKVSPLRTHFKCGHPITEENTYSAGFVRGKRRVHCRTCRRQQHQEQYNKAKAIRESQKLRREQERAKRREEHLASLPKCENGHIYDSDTRPNRYGVRPCRQCLAEKVQGIASKGFSTTAPKSALDWAEYWDRRVSNAIRSFGPKRAASKYGLEDETVQALVMELAA